MSQRAGGTDGPQQPAAHRLSHHTLNVLAGVGAGTLASLLTHPLDFIRVQQTISPRRSVRSSPRTAPSVSRTDNREAIKKDGVTSAKDMARGDSRPSTANGLPSKLRPKWTAGLAMSLVRECLYSSVRLGVYMPIRDGLTVAVAQRSSDAEVSSSPQQKSVVGEGRASSSTAKAAGKNNSDRPPRSRSPPPPPLWTCAVAGAAAGSLATIASHPFDVIRLVRMTGTSPQGLQNTSNGALLWQLLTQRRAFQALVPALYRSAVFSASQLATYDFVKHTVVPSWLPFLQAGSAVEAGGRRDTNAALRNMAVVVLSSWGASVVSIVCAAPFETIKTKMIAFRYKNMRECARLTVKYDGVRGLWRGSLLMWVRIGPYTLVQLSTWEYLRGQLGLK